VSEAVSNVLLVSPNEARDLLLQGYTYLDVRSEPEFALERPAVTVGGVSESVAWNVPWQRVEGDRLVPNPDFTRVVRAVFATEQPLIVGCRSGSRSLAAIAALKGLGFTRLVQLRHGLAGARDAFGRTLPGWRQSGLGIATGEPPPERSYAALCACALAAGTPHSGG
jgi:rhodanese-related sulfurtransferase